MCSFAGVHLDSAPTVMCWEALIEYTIWREPHSQLLETKPAQIKSETGKILKKVWKETSVSLDGRFGGMSDGKYQALTTIWE